MKSLELRIEGMNCDGCAGTIEALLAREPGVQAARISFAEGTGRIVYDARLADPAGLVAAIRKAGFRVASDPGTAPS